MSSGDAFKVLGGLGLETNNHCIFEDFDLFKSIKENTSLGGEQVSCNIATLATDLLLLGCE